MSTFVMRPVVVLSAAACVAIACVLVPGAIAPGCAGGYWNSAGCLGLAHAPGYLCIGQDVGWVYSQTGHHYCSGYSVQGFPNCALVVCIPM